MILFPKASLTIVAPDNLNFEKRNKKHFKLNE